MIKKLYIVLGNLLTATSNRSMLKFGEQAMTIRQIIQAELEERGWSYYRLIKELKGSIPPTTVYEYLAEKSDLGSERVSMILDVLGLTITPKLNVKRGKRPRKEK